MSSTFARASMDSPWKIPLIQFFTRLLLKDREKKFLNQYQCEEHVHQFIESVVSDLWMFPSTTFHYQLIEQSVDFMKFILVFNIITEHELAAIANTLTKMTECPGGLFMCLSASSRKTLMEVVYGLNVVPTDLLHNMAILCNEGTLDLSVKINIVSIVRLCFKKKQASVELDKFIGFLISVIIGCSVKDLQYLNATNPNSISWNKLNIFEDKEKELPIDFAIEVLQQMDLHENMWMTLLPAIGKLLTMLQRFPASAAVGLTRLLQRISLWRISPTEALFDYNNIDSEINQVADFVSSVLLHSVSKTYNLQFRKHALHSLRQKILFSDTLCLLADNEHLLSLLIKKWIHVLKEYKMNIACVMSIMEVLLALLDEPQLRAVMCEFKTNLRIITIEFKDVTLSSKCTDVLKSLKMQVDLL